MVSVNRLSRPRVGTVQLTPAPAKNPFFAWKVSPSVARVRFSVAETVGANVLSVPRTVVPLRSETVSDDGTWPFNSPTTRRKLRDGKVTPVPQRNAPFGASNPSGLPRNS